MVVELFDRLAAMIFGAPKPKKVVRKKKPLNIKGKELKDYKLHYEDVKPKKF